MCRNPGTTSHSHFCSSSMRYSYVSVGSGREWKANKTSILRTLKILRFCLIDVNICDYFLALSRIAFHHLPQKITI